MFARIAWLGLIVPLGAFAQDGPLETVEKIEALDSFRDPPAVLERRAAIQAELPALLGHEWAGAYFMGDGRGFNIELDVAPRSGVAASWHGCMGVYGSNVGQVQQDAQGALLLDYREPNVGKGIAFPERLVPLRWGDRHYLVESDRMLDFANAVNRGFEPRFGHHGGFLLREGDWELPIADLPELPAPARALLRRTEVELGVRSVRKVDEKVDEYHVRTARFELELDHGTRDGIVPGLQLDSPGARAEVIVTEADETSARAIATEHAYGGAAITEPPVAGWRLWAHAFDRAEIEEDYARASARQVAR